VTCQPGPRCVRQALHELLEPIHCCDVGSVALQEKRKEESSFVVKFQVKLCKRGQGDNSTVVHELLEPINCSDVGSVALQENGREKAL